MNLMLLNFRNWRRRRLWLSLLGVAAVVAAVAASNRAAGRGREDLGPLFAAQEGPLTISVVTAGTVQSRRNISIRSEVEGRNTIIWLVEDGKSVTNGELLVELDTSTFVDKLTDQQILAANADASLTQAQEKLAIARNEQEASVAEAELKLELARLDEAKYNRGEYPQSLQEAESKIALAHEEVERAIESLNWSRRLGEEGYLTRTELQADELALKQKRAQHEAAVTGLNVLTNFTARQQRATMSSNLRQAEMALDRITRQTRANVIQAESDLRARQLELDRQKARLEKLELQVRNCRIAAPTNGVVIYTSTIQSSQRRWGNEPLQAGSQVNERQDLMQIPIDGGMIVELSVPEANLTKLRTGQAARITVEALPGRAFNGRLSKIGMLPDGRNAWLNPDLKLYNCQVEIDQIESLRAGMSCEVELLVEEYDQALHIPVQCVLRVGEVPTVYVVTGGRPRPRAVEIGLDNNRMVRVLSGLKPGESVMMNPPLDAATVDKSPVLAIGRDGATGAPGKAPPAATVGHDVLASGGTNQLAAVSRMRPGGPNGERRGERRSRREEAADGDPAP